MALCARLLGGQLRVCQGLRPAFATQCRQVTIQPKPAEVPIQEGHDERNMRLGRPQSPHLSIYKWQLTAVLSITHRCTGLALSGYSATFAVVSLLSNKPMAEIIQNISYCYPNFFLLFKLGLIFPFTYHFFNGIRHLVWDSGKSLSIKGVYTSGYIMLLAAGVSALALFIWDTGKCLSIKGVYVTGYLMVFFALSSFGGLIYFSEELKRIAREEEAKKKAEEAARLAAEAASKSKKKKK